MRVLITGGAGYIGSVTVEALRRRGDEVVVLDNLSQGHMLALPKDVPFHQAEVGDPRVISRIVRDHGIEACVHFAAFAYVGESVVRPGRYFQNNVSQGLQLLCSLQEAGVRHMVFSSSCATYGSAQSIPISETHPQWPANPYGWSKFFFERALEAFETAHDFRYVGLRYFNAAGSSGRLGEDHTPETHLIPNVLAVPLGRSPHVTVFGADFPTADGFAVRDYIHVSDLAGAHVLALDYLWHGGKSEFLNLGTGRGHSVREVIAQAESACGTAIPFVVEPRRPGDVPELVADPSLARSVLGWVPLHSGLSEVIRSAWRWHASNPDGYAGNSASKAFFNT